MFKIADLIKATNGSLCFGNKDSFVRGVSIDSRTLKKGEAFIALKGDKFDGNDFIDIVLRKKAACIITEKRIKQRVNIPVIRVKNAIYALGDIARFNRDKFNIPVIAVTGSNGKTTTKDLIAWILSSKLKVLKNEGTKNNHIGLPLTLLKLDSSYDVAVLEMGTNHFGEIRYLGGILKPNIGVITNIGPSHLMHFKDLNGVFKEKSDLLKLLDSPAIAILNADDPFLCRMLKNSTHKQLRLGIGIKNKCEFRAYPVQDLSDRSRFRVNKRFKFALNVPGHYNIHNSLAAIAVSRVLGFKYPDIALWLSRFNLPKGRLNFVTTGGLRFIDDTYNANPLSLKQALGVLERFKTRGRKIAVIGDMLELGRESKVIHIKAIEETLKICDILITVGKINRSSLKEARLYGREVYSSCSSVKAREILFKKVQAKPNDIILVKGSRMMHMEEVLKS
jgi:UDP-N-acetylmuramoyl-tripeptide--D-alanyl-D-alanine ligase